MKLPQATFSTDELEAIEGICESDIVDAWTDAMSVFFKPDQLKDHALREKLGVSGPVAGHIETFLFPGMMSIKVAASGQQFSRTSVDAAHDGLDGILVQFWQEGQLLDNGPNPRHTRCGDIHLVDFTRDITVNASDFNTYNLLVPREVLDSAVIDLDSKHQQTLSGDMASVRLLRRHLYELHHEARHMTIVEGQALVEATIALLKATLSSHPDTQEEAAAIIDRNLLLEIRQIIDTQLHDPQLTPDMIAHQLGVSRAKLYRLTAPPLAVSRNSSVTDGCVGPFNAWRWAVPTYNRSAGLPTS